MQLEREIGGWGRSVIRLKGGFRINGTSDPDDIRDFNSNMIATVVRTSAGLFTVTLASPANGGFTALPEKVFITADLAQVAGPAVWSRAHYVVDSYVQATGVFQIQVLKATASGDTADAASDADDNDYVTFELVGSISSVGTD